MCVRIKQRLLSVSIWTLTTCVFLYQGSLSERRRSFKTEVSFTWLFFCVGAGLLSFVIGSKCPCSQSALVLLGKTIRSGARLSKAPETLQARKASLSVSNNRELYTPETSCVKWASVYMWMKNSVIIMCEILLWLSGFKNFSGPSRNGPQVDKIACYLVSFCDWVLLHLLLITFRIAFFSPSDCSE